MDDNQIMTILIVDDDPMQRMTRAAVLKRAGFDTCAVPDGQSAVIELLNYRVPGLVLLDHCLASETGRDVVHKLRWLQPYLPIVIISGQPGIENEYAGLDVTVKMKPLPPPELIALCRAASA